MVFELKQLSARHLSDAKELCRQMPLSEDRANPDAHVTEATWMTKAALAPTPDPSFHVIGAFEDGTDDVVGFAVTLQKNFDSMTKKTAEAVSEGLMHPQSAFDFLDALLQCGALPADGVTMLNHIVVDAVHRRCGVGRQLLRAAAKAALQSGSNFIMLACDFNNKPACALYLAEGFKQFSTVNGLNFVLRLGSGSRGGGRSLSSPTSSRQPGGAKSAAATAAAAARVPAAAAAAAATAASAPAAAAAPPAAAPAAVPTTQAPSPGPRVWGQSFQRPRGDSSSGGGGTRSSGSGSGSSSSGHPGGVGAKAAAAAGATARALRPVRLTERRGSPLAHHHPQPLSVSRLQQRGGGAACRMARLL